MTDHSRRAFGRIPGLSGMTAENSKNSSLKKTWARRLFPLLSVAMSLGAFLVFVSAAYAEGRLGGIEGRPIEAPGMRGELEARPLDSGPDRPLVGDRVAEESEGALGDRIDREEIDRKLGKEDIHACKDGKSCSPF